MSQYSNILDKYRCNNCGKTYKTIKGITNHIEQNHQNENLIDRSIITEKEEKEGWNKDQLELALELSMKEQYKDFIPDEDTLNEIISNKLCIICSSKKADVAFIDCGHMVTCNECANKIRKSKCPVCRKNIKAILKIYS